MKQYIFIFILLSLSILHTDCKKTRYSKSDLLEGKISKIQLSYSGFIYNFYFYYNSSTGTLNKITSNNKDYVVLNNKSNCIYELVYYENAIDSNSNAIYHIYAYYSNSIIYRLAEYHSISGIETDILLLNSNNGIVDTIRQFISSVISNVKLYDYLNEANNTKQMVRSYDNFFTGNHIDTINFYYSNLQTQSPNLPQQKIYSYNSLLGYGTTLATDPIYLIELNGLKSINNNHNLIDSIFAKNSSGTNTLSKYYYTFKENRISDMRIEGIVEYNYKFEYY